MSIHYTLYLVGDRRPADVMKTVGRAFGIDLASTLASDAIDGLTLRAKAVKAPVDQFIEMDHGLRPQIALSMFLDKDDLSTAEASVVAVLRSVVGQDSLDLVLLRQDESVAYRRVGGESEIAESDPIWASPKNRAKMEARRRGTLA